MKNDQYRLFEPGSLGEFVSAKRAELGKSLSELAAASGLPKATVSRVETGRTPDPRGSTLRALARALHVGVDELVSRV
jgi:transcriptional regulator with XRE-family HTH domain